MISSQRLWRAVGLVCCAAVVSCSGDDGNAAQDSTTTMAPAVESTTTTSSGDLVESTTTTTLASTPDGPGVDDTAIRIGLSVDLSGPLSDVDSFILDAQLAYFSMVNREGGIDGREVDVVALDHASDPVTHVDNVQELVEDSERGIALISSVGGDSLSELVAPSLAEADVIGISRGHVQRAEPAMRRHVLRIGQSTCVDAYAGVARLTDVVDQEVVPTSLAIIARDDVYGERSALGARLAAEALGLELVLDYNGEIDDDSIDELLEVMGSAEPDLIWVATSPQQLRDLFVGLVTVSGDARWGGAYQSYDALLLESSVAAIVSESYVHTAPIEQFDHDDGRSSKIRNAFPDAPYLAAESLNFGWQQAELAHAILRAAAEAGDLSRAGIVVAAQTIDRPTPSSHFFAVDAQQATLRQRLSEQGTTGLRPLDVPAAVSPAGDAACR